MVVERILALGLAAIALAIAVSLLRTGRFVPGVKGKPLWNVFTTLQTNPRPLHPLTVRFVAVVIAGFAITLGVQAFRA